MEFDIVNVVSQVGFPIAVAAYSLVKLNKTIEANTKMLNTIAAKLNCDGVIEAGGVVSGK